MVAFAFVCFGDYVSCLHARAFAVALRFYRHCKSEKTAAIIEVCREDYIKVVERLDASQKENMVIN